jgi:hypothetical protein
MKGVYGLVIAIVMGLAAGLFNWAYLESRSSGEEKVAFVGIKADVELQPGQRLDAAQLEPVEIPRRVVGNLQSYAVLYSSLPSVLNRPVWRPLSGGSLLLEQDLRTPPQKLDFGPNERVVWVGVDNRSLVPSLITPGDLVSFRIPSSVVPEPTPAEEPAAEQPGPAPRRAKGGEVVGPFKVLSLGNRLGSSDVLRASKIPQVQENVIAIALTVDKEGNFTPDAEKLFRIVDEGNYRPLRIILHPRQKPQ